MIDSQSPALGIEGVGRKYFGGALGRQNEGLPNVN